MPLPPADDGAVRLVAREVSELMLARGARWQAASGTDRLDCLLFQVVLSANLAHLPVARQPLGEPPPARRPISLMAVSQSMHLPYETVRRRIAHLRSLGLVTIDPGGAAVPPDALPRATAAEVAASDAAAFGEALRSLAAEGHRMAIAALDAGVAEKGRRVQARALLDFAVRIMADFVPYYGSMIAGTLCVAIVAANVRHLPPGAADRMPEDAERRPMPLRALARALDLPWETVRRQSVALMERGMIVMVDGGAIVPAEVLASEPHQRNNRHILIQFDRMLGDLIRA
ncbi:hypothetical protein [Sphingomonas sp.]|uniref:hypothetical protein n=1 Tax=Sphingomonas sp. TaxID=28214 RepID=UPI0035C7A1E0